MKVVKYDPRNARDTQQIVDLFNRNGMYSIPGVKTIRPEDWLLSYQAKEMDSYGYFIIKNNDDEIIGGVGVFKYTIRGDAPQNVLMSGSLLIDKRYRNGSTILQLNEELPSAFSKTTVGHFISEILSRNRPSLELSKLNGYRSIPYAWEDLLHYSSYEAVGLAAGNAIETNQPAWKINHVSLSTVISQKMDHNNIIMTAMTQNRVIHLIKMGISLFGRYPYYLSIKNFVMGRLEKKAGTYYVEYRVARPGLFSALQIDNGRPHPLDQLTGKIKLPAYREGATCHVRFIKSDRFLDLKFRPAATPGYHRRGLSIDRKNLTDLKMSYAGFRLFFNRFNGDVYFKYHDSILLTDVFCQAYYQGPGHFEFTKDQNTLRIDMTNANYHIVKRIQFNDDQIVDKYQVLNSKKKVMAKTGFLLNHQDYLMGDSGGQKYQRKVPLVDVDEGDSFLYKRLFNAEPKNYLIEHANVHLRVKAQSSSNQWRFRPLILMEITKGATLQYHYSLTKLDHSIIPANSSVTTRQPVLNGSYQINHALIGRVWEDEVVNLKRPLAAKKIKDQKLSQSHPVRFRVASRPVGYYRQLRFQICSFDDPVAQFSDGRKRQLNDYMGSVETFGKVKVIDQKNTLEIVAPHSWLSLYLDNNRLKVEVICERATTVSVF